MIRALILVAGFLSVCAASAPFLAAQTVESRPPDIQYRPPDVAFHPLESAGELEAFQREMKALVPGISPLDAADLVARLPNLADIGPHLALGDPGSDKPKLMLLATILRAELARGAALLKHQQEAQAQMTADGLVAISEDGKAHLRPFDFLHALSDVDWATSFSSVPVEEIAAIRAAALKLIAVAEAQVESKLCREVAQTTADDILRHQLDHRKIHLSGPPTDDPDDASTRDEGTANSIRAKMSAIDGIPVIRISIPERKLVIVLVDIRFSSPYSDHFLKYLARQRTRSNKGEGAELFVVSLNSFEGHHVIDAARIPPPTTLSDRFTNTVYAIREPITRSHLAYLAMYLSAISAMNYVALAVRYYGHSFIQHLGDPSFYTEHAHALIPNIVMSSLIGLFNPQYRYLFLYGTPAQQFWMGLLITSIPTALANLAVTVGSSAFISPAGFWASISTSLVTLGIVFGNGIFANWLRGLAYALSSSRTARRLNTEVWQLPFGIGIKRQQVEAEFTGYQPLFLLKTIALLIAGDPHAPEELKVFAFVLYHLVAPILFYSVARITFHLGLQSPDLSKEDRGELQSAIRRLNQSFLLFLHPDSRFMKAFRELYKDEDKRNAAIEKIGERVQFFAAPLRLALRGAANAFVTTIQGGHAVARGLSRCAIGLANLTGLKRSTRSMADRE